MTGTTASDKVSGDTSGNAELLRAGAVLPAGTEGAGASAVELTARTYRHPALGDDRVVVRLSTAELGPAEDLAAGFLGLEPHGEPAVVGLGRRQELGFPEWVLVHHPEDGHHALAVVPELDQLARRARTKPKAALDACLELADRLGSAVPHFLPVFHEQAARIFLGVENTTYAGQLFTRARASEAQYGLAVDDDRLDAVFLEFALAGALPVKVLTGYGKELAARLAPAEAHERFRRLCVRRTAGGLAPSAQVTAELRRLARAAGLSPAEAEQDYLAALLPLPATLRAADGWWKTHRAALVALARRVPAVRGTFLEMMPPSDDGELSDLWLGILTESGADAGLTGADVPPEERCADGAAGWLERFHTVRHRGWGSRPALPALLDLVERAAGALRADLAARPDDRAFLRIGAEDLDLLDLLLSLGLPVAHPEPEERGRRGTVLNLADWARGEDPRDLTAIAADPRFRPAFRRAADNCQGASDSEDLMRRLAASDGGRPMLAEWMREVARASVAAGLPGLPRALARLSWLPAEALALAPDEVAAAAGADLGETLARTLRGGLWEEFHWPAWEEAVAELAPGRDRLDQLTVCEAWPHLIVANAHQVRVIDADSTVLTHDLRLPSAHSSRQCGFHYVDGALLVFWTGYGSSPVQGYWHTAPDDVFTLDADVSYWSPRSRHLSLPLPGGGRTTGGGVLHAGDTRLPRERPVLSDGTSYWVWENTGDYRGEGVWVEYDPAEGTRGRRSLPGFLADATRSHAPGAELAAFSSWVRPAPTVAGSALGTPADGLLGLRVLRIPGNGWCADDTAGRGVSLPEGSGMPLAALTFPGDDRPRTLTGPWRELVVTDPDGVVTTISEGDRNDLYTTAAAPLPPVSHFYALRPRDPRGSAVLRAADAETAGTLLKAAVLAERVTDLPGLVTAALPAITAPELIAGAVKAVRLAVAQQEALDAVAARLAAGAEEPRVEGPADSLLAEALGGLTDTGYYSQGADTDVTHRFLAELAAARADTSATVRPGLLHYDLTSLPYSALPFVPLLDEPAAIAYRAVAPGGDAGHRAALLTVLGQVDALGLAATAASAGHWRRVRVHLATPHLHTPDGLARGTSHRAVLPLGGGAVLGFTENDQGVDDGREFEALFHDPGGRFEVPGPYTPRGSAPMGDGTRGAGWLTAFLREAEGRAEVPLLPEAVEEFARLTGVSGALARLVLAGVPAVDGWRNDFLSPERRKALGLKATEAKQARDELRALSCEVRRAVVAALVPADPARLWTEGPDVASAADVWNARVGRRTRVPDWLVAETTRAVRGNWPAHRALPALLDPASSPELGTDVAWHIAGDCPAPVTRADAPFTSSVLTGAVGLAAWLAHRLPVGDPVRAVLPGALTALRQRLAAPGLLLAVGHYTSLADFRKVAGTPTETAPDHERYGAVLMATHDGQPQPAVRPVLLDSTGSDPYLTVLRGPDQEPTGTETALRRVREPAFARLLADPGAPAAGEPDPDGTWWPQDPSRSAPDLVAEVARTHGLGADAATLYLTLLALPDPTDRNTARWTGWKPARLKAARAELAATDLVVTAVRARAGRSLFLPGAWSEQRTPALPVERWKLPMYGPVLGALVPVEPAAELFARAWRRILDGDVPRFEELKVRRTRRRR